MLNKALKNMILETSVILSTRQKGIAGLGAKDLVSDRENRFFA
jgi:hypothetical protein